MVAIGSMKGLRLFRNNTGMGWAGKLLKRDGNLVILSDARPLHAGLIEGSSDIVGWKSVNITPDMVGKRVAIFTAIEVKTGKGKTSPNQLRFLEAVKVAGGIAGIVRNTDEAQELVK